MHFNANYIQAVQLEYNKLLQFTVNGSLVDIAVFVFGFVATVELEN